jgi:hypothetical protein
MLPAIMEQENPAGLGGLSSELSSFDSEDGLPRPARPTRKIIFQKSALS